MPTVLRHETMPIQSEADMVAVRQAVRAWSVQLNFSLVDQTKIVTAASELARNALVHGGGGRVEMEAVEDGGRTGLRLRFEDDGPGIPDIGRALQDGYTTGKGMGLGLGGAKRLTNEFHIDSEAGKGTRVVVTRWKH